MSNPTPAGWYPDATAPGTQRWWDGTQWTDRVQTPYQLGGIPPQRAAEGTSPFTVQIWLIIAVFVVEMIMGVVYTLNIDYSNIGTTGLGAYSMLTTPMYFIQLGVGFLAYVATATLAYFDWKALKARGVPNPFHFAFAFVPFVYQLVYVIGRSVVVYKRTSTGLSPMIILLALYLTNIVLSFAIGFFSTALLFEDLGPYYP